MHHNSTLSILFSGAVLHILVPACTPPTAAGSRRLLSSLAMVQAVSPWFVAAHQAQLEALGFPVSLYAELERKLAEEVRLRAACASTQRVVAETWRQLCSWLGAGL